MYYLHSKCMNFSRILEIKLTLQVSTIKMTAAAGFFWSLENSSDDQLLSCHISRSHSCFSFWVRKKRRGVFCNEFRQIHSKSKWPCDYHLPYFTLWFRYSKITRFQIQLRARTSQRNRQTRSLVYDLADKIWGYRCSAVKKRCWKSIYN